MPPTRTAFVQAILDPKPSPHRLVDRPSRRNRPYRRPLSYPQAYTPPPISPASTSAIIMSAATELDSAAPGSISISSTGFPRTRGGSVGRHPAPPSSFPGGSIAELRARINGGGHAHNASASANTNANANANTSSPGRSSSIIGLPNSSSHSLLSRASNGPHSGKPSGGSRPKGDYDEYEDNDDDPIFSRRHGNRQTARDSTIAQSSTAALADFLMSTGPDSGGGPAPSVASADMHSSTPRRSVRKFASAFGLGLGRRESKKSLPSFASPSLNDAAASANAAASPPVNIPGLERKMLPNGKFYYSIHSHAGTNSSSRPSQNAAAATKSNTAAAVQTQADDVPPCPPQKPQSLSKPHPAAGGQTNGAHPRSELAASMGMGPGSMFASPPNSPSPGQASKPATVRSTNGSKLSDGRAKDRGPHPPSSAAQASAVSAVLEPPSSPISVQPPSPTSPMPLAQDQQQHQHQHQQQQQVPPASPKYVPPPSPTGLHDKRPSSPIDAGWIPRPSSRLSGNYTFSYANSTPMKPPPEGPLPDPSKPSPTPTLSERGGGTAAAPEEDVDPRLKQVKARAAALAQLSGPESAPTSPAISSPGIGSRKGSIRRKPPPTLTEKDLARGVASPEQSPALASSNGAMANSPNDFTEGSRPTTSSSGRGAVARGQKGLPTPPPSAQDVASLADGGVLRPVPVRSHSGVHAKKSSPEVLHPSHFSRPGSRGGLQQQQQQQPQSQQQHQHQAELPSSPASPQRAESSGPGRSPHQYHGSSSSPIDAGKEEWAPSRGPAVPMTRKDSARAKVSIGTEAGADGRSKRRPLSTAVRGPVVSLIGLPEAETESKRGLGLYADETEDGTDRRDATTGREGGPTGRRRSTSETTSSSRKRSTKRHPTGSSERDGLAPLGFSADTLLASLPDPSSVPLPPPEDPSVNSLNPVSSPHLLYAALLDSRAARFRLEAALAVHRERTEMMANKCLEYLAGGERDRRAWVKEMRGVEEQRKRAEAAALAAAAASAAASASRKADKQASSRTAASARHQTSSSGSESASEDEAASGAGPGGASGSGPEPNETDKDAEEPSVSVSGEGDGEGEGADRGDGEDDLEFPSPPASASPAGASGHHHLRPDVLTENEDDGKADEAEASAASRPADVAANGAGDDHSDDHVVQGDAAATPTIPKELQNGSVDASSSAAEPSPASGAPEESKEEEEGAEEERERVAKANLGETGLL